MAETSELVPNLDEIMEEYVPATEKGATEETTRAELQSELPEAPAVPRKKRSKGKRVAREEEDEVASHFVSDEAYSNWEKHYANKGFVAERRFQNPISPLQELIMQRGWETFCTHQKSGYAAVVREFYSNMVGRKNNSVFVRGIWVPYHAEAINEAYGLKGQKNGSKLQKLEEEPNFEKIAKKLTNGKENFGTKKGGVKPLHRGNLTEEAKVWFYFVASVLLPSKHLSTVREQEAKVIYAILKGYKMNPGSIIEGSILGYHESNKKGLIPHPATISILCLKAGVRGDWEEEEEVPRTSPLWMKGMVKGPRNQRKEAAATRAEERARTPNAIATEEGPRGIHHGEDTAPFADDGDHYGDDRLDFNSPMNSPPHLHFRELGESSKGRADQTAVMEMLREMQDKMEERENNWELRHQCRESEYENELRRRDEFWAAELKRRDQFWEEEFGSRNREQGESSRGKEENREILEVLMGIKENMAAQELRWEQQLKVREEEWKKELQRREEELLSKIKFKMEAFYNNQFSRDAELLEILRKKEAEQEAKMLNNIEGFKYLHQEQSKEFARLMTERDKEIERNDAYRQRLWLESLQLITTNLSNLQESFAGLEGGVNKIGIRQDTLLRAIDLTNDLCVKAKEVAPELKRERAKMKFPTFDPSIESFDLDPPDILPKKPYKRPEDD